MIDRTIHRQIVAEIRRQKAALVADLEARLRELEAVERYHARCAGENVQENTSAADTGGPSDSSIGQELFPLPIMPTTTKHEAAAIALRQIGRPARIPELIRVLTDSGYEASMNRKKLTNSLYTAMARKPETFQNNRGVWSLKEWHVPPERQNGPAANTG